MTCDNTCRFWDGYVCTDKEKFVEEGSTSLCCRDAPLAITEKEAKKKKKQKEKS